MDLTMAFLPVVSFVFVIFITIAFLATRYKRCPSDKILVVYGKVGKGQSALCIHGGGAFIWPLIQDYTYMSLTPLTIPIPLTKALSLQNIRVNVPSTFTVGVSTEEAIMNNAAERLLNLAQDDVESMAREIIFGQLRLTVASLTIEQINQDREKFLDAIRRNVAPELNKIGLYLINVNITDITDESGYIESIGKKAASEAINQAKVDVSDQDRKGSVGESEQVRERTIKVAQNVAESEKGKKQAEADKRIYIQQQEALATIGEAEANRDLQIKVAQNEATSVQGQKKAEAEKRIFVEAQEADAIAGENRAKALIAQSNAELFVQSAQASQRGQVAQFDAEAEIQRAQAKAELQRLTAAEVVRRRSRRPRSPSPRKPKPRRLAAKPRASPTPRCSSTKPRQKASARCSRRRRRVTRRWSRAPTTMRAPRPHCCSPRSSSTSSPCRSRPSRPSRSTRSRCGIAERARTEMAERPRPTSWRAW